MTMKHEQSAVGLSSVFEQQTCKEKTEEDFYIPRLQTRDRAAVAFVFW